MLIALYQDHHHLPFWHSPKQPQELFDPEVHGARVLYFRPESMSVKEMWLWDILLGLDAIILPIMAHVSAFRQDKEDRTWHLPKRIWVQITTLPSHEPGTIPRIVGEEGKIFVKHLWGEDNGTHNPNELLTQEEQRHRQKSAFWQEFFQKQLIQTKTRLLAEASARAQEAQALAKLYEIIPG